jgi:hypothetical protein
MVTLRLVAGDAFQARFIEDIKERDDVIQRGGETREEIRELVVNRQALSIGPCLGCVGNLHDSTSFGHERKRERLADYPERWEPWRGNKKPLGSEGPRAVGCSA